MTDETTIDTTVGEANGSSHQAEALAAEASTDEGDSSELSDRIHTLVMSRSGMGKTHFIRGWPKPILLLLFDPVGKEQPLLELGVAGGFKKGDLCYYKEVFDKKDKSKLLVRVEYWSEPNPQAPSAYDRWIKRSIGLEADIQLWNIQTLALDTGNYFWFAAHYYGIKHGGFGNNGKGHYGYSSAAVQQFLMMRIPNLLACNTIITCHEAEKQDESDQDTGTVLRVMPAFPGQLSEIMPGAFTEVWHMYKDGDGKTSLLQTQRRATNAYDCKSLLHLPDPIVAHYQAVKQAVTAKP